MFYRFRVVFFAVSVFLLLLCVTGARSVAVTRLFEDAAECKSQLLSLGRDMTLQACTNGPCATYNWRVGQDTPCSELCGDGVQTRIAYCSSSTGSDVDASMCSELPKPPTIRSCNQGPCVWRTGQWTTCSAQQQLREYLCKHGSSGQAPACAAEIATSDNVNRGAPRHVD